MDLERVTFSGEIDAERYQRLVLVAQELGLRVTVDSVESVDNLPDVPAPTVDALVDGIDTDPTHEAVSKLAFLKHARSVVPPLEDERDTRAKYSTLSRTWTGLARISHAVKKDEEAGVISSVIKTLGCAPEFGVLPEKKKPMWGGKPIEKQIVLRLDDNAADELDFDSAVNYVVALAESWVVARESFGNSQSMREFINAAKPDVAVNAPGLATLADYLISALDDDRSSEFLVAKLRGARDFFVGLHKEKSEDSQSWLTFAA